MYTKSIISASLHAEISKFIYITQVYADKGWEYFSMNIPISIQQDYSPPPC